MAIVCARDCTCRDGAIGFFAKALIISATWTDPSALAGDARGAQRTQRPLKRHSLNTHANSQRMPPPMSEPCCLNCALARRAFASRASCGDIRCDLCRSSELAADRCVRIAYVTDRVDLQELHRYLFIISVLFSGQPVRLGPIVARVLGEVHDGDSDRSVRRCRTVLIPSPLAASSTSLPSKEIARAARDLAANAQPHAPIQVEHMSGERYLERRKISTP